MKYLKYNILGLIFGISLITSSCTDWLEMEPINQSYGEGFWVSEEAAQQTTAGAYALLRSALLSRDRGDQFLQWGELASTAMNTRYTNEGGIWRGPGFWNPNMNWFKWDLFYKVIAQTNLILENVDKLDAELFDDGEAGKQKYLGEAYFLRAYTYFYMVKVWGDVPLVTVATSTVEQVITEDGYIKLIPRTPEDEVLTQVMADLKIAEEYLAYGNPGSDEWAVRANKGAVQALMTHVLLWQGNPGEAEKAAGAAIANGGYTLVDYADSNAVVNMFIGQSSEGIFELNIDFEQSESHVNRISSTTLSHPYLWNSNFNKYGMWYVEKNYMEDLYEEDDWRIKRFFGFWEGNQPIILKYANIIYEDEETRFNPHSNNNILLLRLSGLMLLRAEALSQLPGRESEALELLNTVRERANATPYTTMPEDLQYTIFQEREMELLGEGHGWHDRVRQQEWTNIGWMTTQRIQQKGYYWPVALDFIIDNPLIEQNPFWSMIL